MAISGCGYAFGNLRIGGDRVKRRLRAGGFLRRHFVNITVHHRTFALKFVFELKGFYQFVKVRREFALMFRGVLSLQSANRADRLHGGRLVSASDH